MQTIEQKLVVDGPVGTNASNPAPALVVGMKARLVVRAVDSAGTPAAPANIDDVSEWRFILAQDWNPATTPCYVAEAEWNPVTATWTVLLDRTRTAEMLDAIGTKGSIDIGCEIAGLPEDGTWDRPLYVVQWTMTMRNRRDSDGSPTPVDPAPITAHAATHASDGTDPVTPAAIGAAAADHVHASVAAGDTVLAAVNGGTATITRQSGYGNATVSFPDGFSISYESDAYTAPSGGETVEFVGPYSVPGMTFWVPSDSANPESFDPSQNSVWCLFANGEGATAPSYLMFGTGPMYEISSWNSQAPSLTLNTGTASGYGPSMQRQNATTTKTVATTDQIPSVPSVIDPANATASGAAADALATKTALAAKQDNMVVLTYGTSTWAEFTAAYAKNAVIFCRKQTQTNVYRMAFLAFVSGNDAEFQYYRSVGTHDDTNQCDQVFIYKLTSGGTWSETTREAALKITTGTGIAKTVTQSAGAGTIQLALNPAPTTSDNGKVLGVTDSSGTLGWVAQSGGGNANLLAYTTGTTLDPDTAVYKGNLASDGTFPTITDTAISTASAYFQFELELTVPSTVPSTITGPSGWTFLDGHGLPDPADLTGGETIYISVRLDCTARTFLASVWRVA